MDKQITYSMNKFRLFKRTFSLSSGIFVLFSNSGNFTARKTIQIYQKPKEKLKFRHANNRETYQII